LADQYMLGDSLLVAPIFREDGIAEYYLPEGTWTSFLTGEVKEGGKWYTEKHGYLSIPLYVRENSIVAVGAKNDNAVYDYADNVTFRAYAIEAGKTARTTVYNTENEPEASISITHDGSVYKISADSPKSSKVELVNVGTPSEVTGAAYHMEENNLVIELSGSQSVEVKF
ncbi:MAG: alpha-xylosidase, partial [Roseburia sp.]|nr:alpha-xylosidase [Roseburia sp.]